MRWGGKNVMVNPDLLTYKIDVQEIIEQQFTPKKRSLPKLTELAVPVFQHPEIIDKTVSGFRRHVERFVQASNPLITETLKYARIPSGTETELLFDYDGAIQLFDMLYEKKNHGLLCSYEDPVTNLALERLYGAGYCLGRALLAEEVLRRDNPAYRSEQRYNIANELIFQYTNIALQEAIILRHHFPELRNALNAQAAVCQQLDDELYIHTNNYFALLAAAQVAFEDALPKKLEEYVIKQKLTYYENDKGIGVFLPYHTILTDTFAQETKLLHEQIGTVDLQALPPEKIEPVFRDIERLLQTERDVLFETGSYKKDITEPHIAAARNALFLELILLTGDEVGDLRDRVAHNYLFTSARSFGLRHPTFGHTLDMQLRLCPVIKDYFEHEAATLSEVVNHALWVYNLKDDKPLNPKQEIPSAPIIDLGGVLN